MTWPLVWLIVVALGVVIGSMGAFSYDMDWCIGVGLTFLLVGFVGLVVVADNHETANHTRLMRQCMDAGLPEYECVSKLKQDVVPVFIPMAVGR